MSEPTVGSLFSGIGGIDLAFQREGFDIAFQVEIDPYCTKVLAKHWPDVPRFKDVKHVGRHNLPIVDVLAGGFPCQDISAAGKGAGIIEGNRSGLWFEFARIIGELRPHVVFLENVPAITSNGGTLVIAQLAALGYGAEWCIIPASAVGAPHLRNRWFCVAYTDSFRRHEPRAGQSSDDVEWNDPTSECARRAVVHASVASGSVMADADRGRIEEQRIADTQQHAFTGTRCHREAMANASGSRRQEFITAAIAGQPGHAAGRIDPAACPGCERGSHCVESGMVRILNGLSIGMDGSYRWPAKPGQPQHDWEPSRTVDLRSVPNRTNRLKALGNAVVPQVIQPFAKCIYEYLAND